MSINGSYQTQDGNAEARSPPPGIRTGDVEVVLDDDHRVPVCDEPVDDGAQPVDVADLRRESRVESNDLRVPLQLFQPLPQPALQGVRPPAHLARVEARTGLAGPPLFERELRGAVVPVRDLRVPLQLSRVSSATRFHRWQTSVWAGGSAT